MTYPIPSEALDDRLAIVGTAGSGKSYMASGAVERILARKGRCIVVDPLGVWFGLRLMPDGKTPSPFNPVIFGGPHGDLPINEHAGSLIGETVAGMAESCIVDLSEIGTKNGERRFMLALLTALYRKTGGDLVHLVVDEADMFAPQKLDDKEGEAAKLLGMMETIVRRGRVKGFIPWLITQRPAVLNKNVLSQADGVVAMKMTGEHDRKAIGGWIEGQADPAKSKEILASLAAKQKGEGVVWIPGRAILDHVQFPVKLTFDSSRAPKRGEKKHATALTPIDLGALKDRLATVESEQKANDPKALKAEIARLKSEAAKIIPKNIPDEAAAYQMGVEAGKAIGENEGYGTGQAAGRIAGYNEALKVAVSAYSAAIASVTLISLAEFERSKPLPSLVPSQFPKTPSPAKPIPLLANVRQNASSDLTAPQQRVIRSLLFWHGRDKPAPTRAMVAGIAGYSPGSGGFNNLLGGLKSLGLIDYPAPGTVSIVGNTGFHDIIDEHEARQILSDTLSTPQKKIVAVLASQKFTMTRDEVARASDYSAGSGGFNNLLGSLRTLDIITYPAKGCVSLTDWAREVLG